MTLTQNRPPISDPEVISEASARREIRDASLGRRISLLVLPVILAATVVCIIYPFATLLIAAFVTGGEGGNPWERVAQIPQLWDAVRNTILLVVCATGASLVIGTALAWLNEKTNVRMRGISSIVPILPLLMPPVAGALGYVFLFSPEAGIANGWLASTPAWLAWALPDQVDIYTAFGVIYTTSIYTVPAVYVLVAAALRNLDGSQIEASRMCGVGPLRSALRIDLAALRPTLASSAILALISSVAMFTIPVVIGTRARFPVMSVLIYEQLHYGYPPRLAEAIILGLVMLSVVQVGLIVEYMSNRRARLTRMKSRSTRTNVIELGIFSRWTGRVLTAVYLLAGTIIPAVGLLIVSVQPFWTSKIDWAAVSLNGYIGLVNDAMAQSAFRNSVMLGAVGATIVLVMAALTVLTMRNAPGWLVQATNAITGLPASIPHTVVGVAFLISFGTGFLKLSGTLTILLLAYVLMYVPHAMRAAHSAYSQAGDDLFEASSMSGAGPWRTYFKVMLPLMTGGLIAGWVLVFVHMVNEITASVFLASSSGSVIGPYIIDLWLNVGNYPRLASLAMLLCLGSSVIVGAALAIGRRSALISRS